MLFGSDNQSGASRQVLETLLEANSGHQASYGDDTWTQRAVAHLRQVFETDAEIYFVTTGTAANCLALACLTKPWSTVLCHGQAHINNDELTAPEFFTQGTRLIGLDPASPKLEVEALEEYFEHSVAHAPHNSEPSTLSLTQATESGQVYSPKELLELTTLAKQNGMNVHMDGARFSNALVSQNCTPAELTWKAGIDVLTLGASKNGALAAEAVIFFNKKLAEDFVPHRKRTGHLLSKGRFMGAQFMGWLANNHWLDLAKHANQMAYELNQVLQTNPYTQVLWPVPANEIFAVMPKDLVLFLRNQGAEFFDWPTHFVPAELGINPKTHSTVRFVTSYITSSEQIQKFAEALSKWKS